MVAKGLNGLSIRALAQATDYSPAAVYKYFESKEQILAAIRDEGWGLAGAMLATAASLAQQAPPPQRLVASGLAFLKFAATYPEHYQLMFNTPDLPSSGPSEMGGDANFKGLVDTVAEGVSGGYFQLPEGYTPLLMAFHLWISSHGMAMLKQNLMRADSSAFDALCEDLIKLFVQSITLKKDENTPMM